MTLFDDRSGHIPSHFVQERPHPLGEDDTGAAEDSPPPQQASAERRIARTLLRRFRLRARLAAFDRLCESRLSDVKVTVDTGLRWTANNVGKSLLLPLLHGTHRIAPGHRFSLQAEALLLARSRGWEAAAPLFREIANRPDAARFSGAATALLRNSPAVASGPLALPAPARAINLPREIAERIVIYTTRFGSEGFLPPLHGAPEGVRCVCLTDRPIPAAPGWEIVRMDSRLDSELDCKLRPHVVLEDVAPQADCSLFLAPDRMITGNLHTLLSRWLWPQDFAMWAHTGCSNWHDLAERLIVMQPASTEAVLKQVDSCAAAPLALDMAAYDTGVIWRRHVRSDVRALMEEWRTLHEVELPGAEDLSIYRLMNGLTPGAGLSARLVIMPTMLGPADNSIFFAQHRLPVPTASPGRLQAPPRTGARLKVAFVYDWHMRDLGSTLMRSRQLSALIAARFGDRYDVTFTADIAALRDQVVIVNRNVIQRTALDDLAALRERNIASISDFLDMKVSRRHDMLFDMHMAFSLSQAVDLQRRFPRTPVVHVTHNVNSDVPHSSAPTDRLRTVYLGFRHNTTYPAALAGEIDLFDMIDASFTAAHWQAIAPRYNCHWIVRGPDRIVHDSWKPFLKGFVAARCGAAVIVARDDANAGHYLGDDYPFFARSLAPADLEEAWLCAASAFGGAEWDKAQDIMRQVAVRSSDDAVAADWKAMIDLVTA